MAKYKVLEAYNDNEVGAILEMDESAAVDLVADGRVALVDDKAEAGESTEKSEESSEQKSDENADAGNSDTGSKEGEEAA